MGYGLHPPTSSFMTYKERCNLCIIYAWIVNRWIVYRELAQPQWNTDLKLVKSNIDELNWSLTYWGTCNLFYGFFNLIESCILNYMIMNFCRQSLHYLSSNIYRFRVWDIAHCQMLFVYWWWFSDILTIFVF